MIKTTICRYCGGAKFIADRSLGGKVICVRCGNSSGNYGLQDRIQTGKRSSNRRFFLLLLIFMIVVIVLI